MRSRGTTTKALQFHLGTDKHHTVYEGELTGMILALELLKGIRGVRWVSLGIDNQAAIRSVTAFKSGLGHYLMDIFHNTLRRFRQTTDIEEFAIRWTPGHLGILGNEESDTLAKEAAQGLTLDPQTLPSSLHRNGKPCSLPYSQLAKKQHFRARTRLLHRQIFHVSLRTQVIRKIDPSMPSKKFLCVVEDLPKRHASILLQLHTDHAPLNKHLHCITKSPSPHCPHLGNLVGIPWGITACTPTHTPRYTHTHSWGMGIAVGLKNHTHSDTLGGFTHGSGMTRVSI